MKDLSKEEIIQVLENEKKCVERNVSNLCDRNCGICDLVLDDDIILSAYTKTIKFVKEGMK